MIKKTIVVGIVLILWMMNAHAQSKFLTKETAMALSKLPLECISKEFPNKTNHSSETATDHVLLPSELHPAFYGCFDWHSSVHGHWMLVKILKVYPDIENREEIIKVLDNSFQAAKILKEAEYFSKYSTTKTFERTYGWAWTLKLDEELLTWDLPLARKWHSNFQPLTATIEELWMEYLPKQTYPNRTGVHPNSAFGLAFAIDWARKAGKAEFEKALIDKAVYFYGNQVNAPAYLEPDGSDFFSPSLQVADLMRRVLSPDAFEQWFDKFLNEASIENVLNSPVVSDRNDYQIVHLDGLSLSRAWCLKGVAKSLGTANPNRKRFLETAERFLQVTMNHVTGSSYGGSHWLGSFAVYAIFE